MDSRQDIGTDQSRWWMHSVYQEHDRLIRIRVFMETAPACASNSHATAEIWTDSGWVQVDTLLWTLWAHLTELDPEEDESGEHQPVGLWWAHNELMVRVRDMVLR